MVGPILVLGPHSVIVFPLGEIVPRVVSADACDACGSTQLVKVKGCVRCSSCGYKNDCNGW